MSKYNEILDQLLHSIEKRDGWSPDGLADCYSSATKEGMYREGICQILADESLRVKLKMFLLYPGLIIPYLCRIRKVKK